MHSNTVNFKKILVYYDNNYDKIMIMIVNMIQIMIVSNSVLIMTVSYHNSMS